MTNTFTFRFLRSMLWAALVLSGLGMTVGEYLRESRDEWDRIAVVTGGGSAEDREDRYTRKLARQINPYGQSAMVFVVSVGFLAVIEAVRCNAAAVTLSVVPSAARTNAKSKSIVVNARDGV